ncbi:MAG: tRNA 2-thiouridine(34) synthase MnmA [Chloroflexi bacterium]|nr:MAG: tRNA 2-thiouridine(34) synthase MnmA [Chloroflexota bacterium]MBL1196021.1 tRNA 2-thiouridine(34) synthase MnmA [Chloroflexota bacterium]NOH13315.1 tRNA 2-thiouridine(34) synthase MnmA [Chloroflexota bacterium]
MSGGVDSSITAALLQQQGYQVIGMMMRLWTEEGREAHNRCCTPASMALARRVAAQLDIPFYAVDAQDTFKETVVSYFLDGYAQATTPNPCLACNRHIRWEFLLNRALALGADFMATGHYARVERAEDNPIRLLKAIDESKDQSYVLSVLTQAQLQHALFPLGDYTKDEVRDLARKFELPVAERQDSQDLCFLADTDINSFLQRNLPEVEQPGPILSVDGEHLGQHQGLAFFTIGQRKGLGISAPHPLYVIAKEPDKNTLIIGPHEALGSQELWATDFNWVSDQAPSADLRAEVKIRYKSKAARATISTQDNGDVHMLFDEPLRDITPGQAAVVYDGDEVLGGGVIRPAVSDQAIPIPLGEVRLHA